MKELNYGFSVQKYENGAEIDTLQTGDGKSEFSPIYFSDQAGIAISYGGGEGVGTTRIAGSFSDEIGAKWQIKFPCRESLQALKNAIEEIEHKDILAPADCTRAPESCPENEGYGCWCSNKSDVATI